MVEAQPSSAGHFLERVEVRGGEDEIVSGRPAPPPSDGCAGDGVERDDGLAYSFDFAIRADLAADVVRRARNAPLDVEAVAVESEEAVDGLPRGRDLTSINDVMRSVQHEGKCGRVRHTIKLIHATGRRAGHANEGYQRIQRI
jgi:hypothetical protein